MRVAQLLPPATTCVPPCTKGAAAVTPSISRRIAAASSSVRVEAAPAPSRAPPWVTLPGVTMARLAPSERICRSTRFRAPAPIATMAITAATPMTMPSTVRSERSVFAPMADRADRTASVRRMRASRRVLASRVERRLPPVLHHPPVPEANDAAGMAGDVGVVGDEDHSDALPVQVLEEPED